MNTFRLRGHRAVFRPIALTLTLGLGAVLSACGGGGSSSNNTSLQDIVTPTTPPVEPPPTPTTQTIEGTAAIGAPIVDGTITARCADGSGFSQTVSTGSDGSWSGTIDSDALPCALQVTGGTPEVTLHSYTSEPGTINITPLTDLVLALATTQTPQDWFNSFDGTPVDTGTASGTLLDSLSSKGFDIPPTGNPFTTPFSTDGTGWDGLLDTLGDSIENDPDLADHAALVALVKDGNLDTLPTAPEPVTYSITGTITGASGSVSWSTVVAGNIVNNGGSASGDVTFSPDGGIVENSNWIVAISASPAGQSCQVNNGSGKLTADVANVVITCADIVQYTLSGTITGATSAVAWEARRNGTTHHSGSSNNGAVTFSQPAGMVENSAWSVVVTTAPAGQSCSVTNGSGTLQANVTNIAIHCSDVVIPPATFAISGSISGASGIVQWRTLRGGLAFHNGSNNNGNVAFTTAAGMVENSAWSVQVVAPPAGQSCTVSNGSGTLTANISNVLISCQDITVVPSDAIYDFSSLNLRPAVPSMTPIAPTVSPVDPSADIAALYAKLAEHEQARIFAPAPANLELDFDTTQNGYSIYQRDPNSSWMREITVNPGADDEVNTADDTIVAYTLYPDGQAGIAYSFTNPGPDGAWFTEDDVPGKHNTGRVVYFPSGVVLEYEDTSEGVIMILPFLDTGADGQLFTADDVVNFGTGYQIAILDGEGNRGEIVTYDSNGADGLWFTADDRVKSYLMATSALSGQRVISVLYDGAGTDGVWFNADDVVDQHTQILLGSDYLPRYSALYDATGSDNTWFTADDRVLAWTYYGYDDNDNAVLVATHTNKGNDGLWFTADDTATGLVSLKDAQGRPILAATITGAGAMGPDGVWLSGDETLYGYQYTEFDANGNQILNAQLQSKGVDGKWFTGDDLPTASYNYWKRMYDAQGRLVQQWQYNPALAPASPAFSVAQLEQYTVYKADFSTSVTVYRDAYGSSFGADNTPFTADDFIAWPYVIETQTGFEQFNQPGADGVWFTGDDIKSGHVVAQYDGNRKTLEQYYDANDEVVSYTEVSELSANSYRTDSYQVDDSGTAVLTGYNITEEDGNGYPRWRTWYSTADEITNVDYTEYDSRGNITRQSAAYSPGNDGIWATQDDFGYYSLQFFNSANDLIKQASEYPGGDRIWGTSDDYTYLSSIDKLDYDFDALSDNSGYLAPNCNDLMSGAAGAINVVVSDQNGNPLAGAIAQLNSQGSTRTTDANGVASFTGLSGVQDVHLFKDGYSWESFYCVAPGNGVTVQARLNSLTELAWNSIVNFQATPGLERFTLRLLDADGKSVATRSHSTSTGADSGQTYGTLHFALPVGSQVNGELWAFQVDNNGRLMSAASLGDHTHTTIASNLYSNYQPIELAFDTWSRIPVATSGGATGPGNLYAQMTVSLGGLYELPFSYDATLGGTYATVPDVASLTLPELAQPTGIRASAEAWQAWYPADLPQLGEGTFMAKIVTGFQYGPLVRSQLAAGDTPVIEWTPARQVKEDAFATVTTLELRSAAGGLGYQSHWTLHAPAGDSSVTLPQVPAGISSAPLPQNRYKMVIRSHAIPALNYHSAVGLQDLHNMSTEFAMELLTTGSDFDEGNTLQR